MNLPAVNTVEDIDGEPVEIVDYLGISVLSPASTLPMHVAESSSDPGATASLSYFIPATRAGQQALPGGSSGLVPLINGEFEPAPTTTPVPETVAPVAPPPPVASPFRLLPGLRLLPGGTRARLGVAAPGPGLLRAFAPALGRARAGQASVAAASARRKKGKRRGKRRRPRLLIPAKRRVKSAGKAYIVVKLTRRGKVRLRRRGKLTVPVRLVFKPSSGSIVRRTRAVTFRHSRVGRSGPPGRGI